MRHIVSRHHVTIGRRFFSKPVPALAATGAWFIGNVDWLAYREHFAVLLLRRGQGRDTAVLIVGKDSQFNSAKDLIAYAEKNPGKVTVSGAGKIVGHHIAYLQLEKAAKVKLTYVPGKGGVGAMKLVKGGQVMAGFNNLSDAARSQGDIKILAVADLERHEFLPDVPTFKELGIPVDNSSVNFRGLMVPKGTDPAIIKFLAETVPVMFGDKKTLGKMSQTNSPVRIMNREEVLAMWKERQSALTELLEGLKK